MIKFTVALHADFSSDLLFWDKFPGRGEGSPSVAEVNSNMSVSSSAGGGDFLLALGCGGESSTEVFSSGLSEGGDASGFFSSSLSEGGDSSDFFSSGLSEGGDSSDFFFSEVPITCVTSSIAADDAEGEGLSLALSFCSGGEAVSSWAFFDSSLFVSALVRSDISAVAQDKAVKRMEGVVVSWGHKEDECLHRAKKPKWRHDVVDEQYSKPSSLKVI